jgi:hypothetical protein
MSRNIAKKVVDLPAVTLLVFVLGATTPAQKQATRYLQITTALRVNGFQSD